MVRIVALLSLIVIGGCFSLPTGDGDKINLVSNNPFGVEAPPAAATKASYPPASNEISLRVDKVGRDLLAANPQIALKPLFGTINAEPLEVFHVETRIIYVTKGVVDKCKTDPE